MESINNASTKSDQNLFEPCPSKDQTSQSSYSYDPTSSNLPVSTSSSLSDSQNQSNLTGAAKGGIAAGVIVGAIGVGLISWYRRSRRKPEVEGVDHIDPFVSHISRNPGMCSHPLMVVLVRV